MDKKKRIRRKKRVRSKIVGTYDRPRLNVFLSNRHIYVQIIDDSQSKTLISSNSLMFKNLVTNKEKVFKVAEDIVDKCKKSGINKIVFDRNGFTYKGRVKLLAERLRELGLEF